MFIGRIECEKRKLVNNVRLFVHFHANTSTRMRGGLRDKKCFKPLASFFSRDTSDKISSLHWSTSHTVPRVGFRLNVFGLGRGEGFI